MNLIYIIISVPTFEMHNLGTVPRFKMHNIGTPIFYNLFLELEFGFYDQNKLLLIAFVFSFKPSKAHLPTPNPFSIMSQSRVGYSDKSPVV